MVQCVEKQHVIAGSGTKTVAAHAPRQPVGVGVACERVVAAAAAGVPHTFGRHIDRLARRVVGNVAQPATARRHQRAAATGGKGMAHGVGDQVDGLGLSGLAPDGEAAGAQHFVAAVDQPALGCAGQADGADAQLGKGFEFAGVGFAVVVGIDPYAQGIPVCGAIWRCHGRWRTTLLGDTAAACCPQPTKTGRKRLSTTARSAPLMQDARGGG